MLNLNKHIFLAILIISIGLLFPYKTFAQKDKQVTRVLFIFDASQSMYRSMGRK